MAFRQKTFSHSHEDNFAIGQGSTMNDGVPALQKPRQKPTLSQLKMSEADQHTADVLEGDASPTGW